MTTTVEPTRYEPSAIDIGIVHIGLGAFVRAHVAVYIERLLNRSPCPWAISAANIRSNQTIVDTLQAQNNQYTVAEYASPEQLTLRQVSCVREVLFAGGGEVEALLERLANPQVRVVTLTVTEKGYFFDAAKGGLRTEAAEIQHDLANPAQPKTVIGILLAALRARRQNSQPPFTVLSCDNMPGNGRVTRAAVIELAMAQDAALADWIATEVSFPSSMVDRIVPAVTDETITQTTAQLSSSGAPWADNAPVACEAFSQWVIEDDFPSGRPQLEEVGAVMVADVAPWEAMKLRMLNGSHSLLAYLGSLQDLTYVSDCMAQPVYIEMLRRYMLEEAAPTLQMPEGTDLDRYADALLERFGNASLHHKTLQIAMDGSQKIPQRWLHGAQLQLQDGSTPCVTALGFAAWIRFLQGKSEHRQTIAISDPLAQELQDLSQQNLPPQEKVLAFLKHSLFSHLALAGHSNFVEEVTAALAIMDEEGVAAAMQRVFTRAC